MFILIVGGGKVGTYLGRDLLKENHEVVIIEKDARKAQFMTNLLEQDIAIVGDGCDPMVMMQAGVSRADVVVADTGDDEDNLVVCLIARKNSKARCIARVNNPRNKEIFDSIGTDENPIKVISSTELILNIIEDEVNISECRPIVALRNGDVELVKIAVDADSPSVGKKIADVGFPRSSIVVAIESKDGEVTIPTGDTRIAAADEVVLMIKRSARAQVRDALLGASAATA
ncbi:MAG: NAD-binding protein [Candidatus Eremiobacteraeota bacterium]|nr:NAD-binding protein [Candidatus Eremiobacteraeota bacterium]